MTLLGFLMESVKQDLVFTSILILILMSNLVFTWIFNYMNIPAETKLDIKIQIEHQNTSEYQVPPDPTKSFFVMAHIIHQSYR